MRRLTISLLVGMLVATVAWSQGADARTKARRVHGTYAFPAVGIAGRGGGFCDRNDGFGCVEFTTKRTEGHITVSIKDSSGQPVFASISQDKTTGGGDAPHMTEPVGDICGKTTKPLPIDGGYPVDVFIWEGPGFDPQCTGFATQGTVTVRFTA